MTLHFSPLRMCVTLTKVYFTLAGVVACSLLTACTFEPQLQEPTPRDSDAGAGADDDGDQLDERYTQVSRLFDSLNQTVRAVRAFECECEIVGQPQTVDECVAATLSVTPPPIVECTKDVLASDDRSLDSVTCEAQAGVSYLECLRMSTCSDFEHILDCQIEYDTYKLTTCAALPWELWAQVQSDCYGIPQPPPFTCDDGEIINSEWVCDFEDDCEDGSDEVACHP